MTIRAYKFQLRIQPRQEAQLRRYAGALRWLWNRALAEQKDLHARGEKYASYVDMAKWLTAWRNAPETAWLSECPQGPQQQVLIRLDESYKRFFDAVRAGKTARIKPPRFKKHGHEPGIRFPDPKQFAIDQVDVGLRGSLNADVELAKWCASGRIRLPKLGWLRTRQSRMVEGEMRNATVVQELGKWFVSIQTRGTEVIASNSEPSIGIDLGLTQFAALSDGVLVNPLNAMARQQRRLRRYQKSVSRKKKGSCNRKKAIVKLSALHKHISNQRSDWLHKLSTGIVRSHPVIAIEDLLVAVMSASAKGTAEKPGKNVRQKAGLNRGIQDAAWAEFRRQLEYKTAAVGGEVIAVDPAYTSQKCSACGHIERGNRLSQIGFICLACGHAENADTNAAKNILAAGYAVWSERTKACGEDVRQARPARAKRATSKKQEPTEEICRA